MTIDWEGEGRRLGASFDQYGAFAVVGHSADAVAWLALGLAKAQAPRRRVVIADLTDDAWPLRSLVTDDDPHGVVDSFVYGISLAKVIRPIAGIDGLFIAPTGSEPPDYAAICRDRRWRDVAAAVRQMGGLLIVAVPADAEALDVLVEQLDGAVHVGIGPSALVNRLLIAIVDPPAGPLPFSDPGEERPPPAEPTVIGGPGIDEWSYRPSGEAVPVSLDGRFVEETPSSTDAPESRRPTARHIVFAVLGSIVAAALVFVADYPFFKPAVRLPPSRPAVLPSPTETGAAPAVIRGMLEIANPQDSLVAAAYSVNLSAANTHQGAILRLQQDTTLPARTFSSVVDNGALWFKVFTGAFAKRESADSMLGELRRKKVIGPADGTVTRTPYAFLLDTGSKNSAIAQLIPAFITQRGLPAYALQQEDGTVWVLLGAFESPAQAATYAQSLRASRIARVRLVFRKGRMF